MINRRGTTVINRQNTTAGTVIQSPRLVQGQTTAAPIRQSVGLTTVQSATQSTGSTAAPAAGAATTAAGTPAGTTSAAPVHASGRPAASGGAAVLPAVASNVQSTGRPSSTGGASVAGVTTASAPTARAQSVSQPGVSALPRTGGGMLGGLPVPGLPLLPILASLTLIGLGVLTRLGVAIFR
ncbi:MAG TPA: hypothetical protein VKX16_07300 [Chloroflexota bacterium]|nr:hypothetical protein [Chloroflexota bacterium]